MVELCIVAEGLGLSDRGLRIIWQGLSLLSPTQQQHIKFYIHRDDDDYHHYHYNRDDYDGPGVVDFLETFCDDTPFFTAINSSDHTTAPIFLVGGFFLPIRFSSSLLTFLLTFSLPPMYSGQFLTSEGNGVEKER